MTRRKPLAGIYQITTFLALVLLLLILFISAAYFFMIPAPDEPSGQGDLLAELETRRSTWTMKRPAAYRYVVDRDCNCERAYTEPYVATHDGDNRSAAFTVEIESVSGEFIATPPGAVWIDDLLTSSSSPSVTRKRSTSSTTGISAIRPRSSFIPPRHRPTRSSGWRSAISRLSNTDRLQ